MRSEGGREKGEGQRRKRRRRGAKGGKKRVGGRAGEDFKDWCMGPLRINPALLPIYCF
jgi:hypothetical protein